MTAIVALRYLVSSGAFALATRLRHPGLYRGRGAQMRREIGWSLASAAIYGLPAGIVARSEEHTSELQSLIRISYASLFLKKTRRNNPPGLDQQRASRAQSHCVDRQRPPSCGPHRLRRRS